MITMMYIYIAKINVSLNQYYVHNLLSYISNDNREKISRLHFTEDKLRTLYGEAVLKHILQKEFGVKNKQIVIGRNTYGKPSLINLDIHFNISHSGEWVVCAVCNQNIGIDIEEISNIDLNLAKKFFSPQEYKYILEKPTENRREAFYDIWTLKESYIKWLGVGLSKPLDSFTINKSESGIALVNNQSEQLPFFKQYPLDGYKMSICSSAQEFPERIELIDDIISISIN